MTGGILERTARSLGREARGQSPNLTLWGLVLIRELAHRRYWVMPMGEHRQNGREMATN